MTKPSISPGSRALIARRELQAIIDHLRQQGYRTVGPRVADGAVVYADVDQLSQFPLGQIDTQDGGFYRLQTVAGAGYFDHVVGPHSLKNYIFPPRETLLTAQRSAAGWDYSVPEVNDPPLAVIGVRSCDLHALAIQDRVFLEGPYVDPAYQARRQNLFLVAVNCRRAAATCFCHSMKTGPQVAHGFDLALTELEDAFVVEVGSERGAAVLTAANLSLCDEESWRRARQLSTELAESMSQRPAEAEIAPSLQNETPRPRSLDTTDIRELLLGNPQHPRWRQVAERCLACANCTLVCPTCFCSSVEEVTDLTCDQTRRERTWASCFTTEHSYLSSGVVRQSIASRYRQWLTHKLASWIDQFGVSGCVGCGRCITWCPVAIDLTEEVAAMRKEA